MWETTTEGSPINFSGVRQAGRMVGIEQEQGEIKNRIHEMVRHALK